MNLKHSKLWNLPNSITIIRIALIPIFVICFYLRIPGHDPNYQWFATSIFIIAAITDWLDGFLARYLKQTSKFGAFLDPVADKLMVLTALLLCASKFSTPLFTAPAIIILCREIIISALREWLAENNSRVKISVNIMGKAKTFIQIIAICFFISQPAGYSTLVIIGYVLFYLAVILTIWSMFIYIKIIIKNMNSNIDT